MKIKFLAAPIFLILLCSVSTYAQLNSLTKDIAKNKQAQYLIKTQKPIDQKTNDIKILSVEGPNTYKVIFDTQIPNQLISDWHRILPEEKYNATLKNSLSSSTIKLLATIDTTVSKALIIAKLQSIGADFTQNKWNNSSRQAISVPTAQLNALASLPFIIYLSPIFTDQTLVNYARAFTGADVAQAPISSGGFGLTGQGVTLGDGDDGAPLHIDITDRLTNFNPEITFNHGIHTTGTATGAGIKDQRYRGFAPKANVLGQFFSGVIAYAPTLYQDYAMRVTNNSYAALVGDCGYAGTYDIYSQILDEQAAEQPQLLHVFAAGNDAYITCSPFPSGYGTVTGAFQPAKNILVVANIGRNLQTLNNYSSRGPVKDGRLKPEITAMGVDLISTVGSNNYAPNTGTSMACPNVAGSAALLYELYKSINSSANPDAALIKATLMNSSKDIGIAGPDYRYGFGLMDVGAAAKNISENHFSSDSLAVGESKTLSINIPNGLSKAKIMLYWSDPAASPSATKALMNDLNFSVSSTTGTNVLPLILNPNSVLSPAIGGMDTLNNVEQVTFNNPIGGIYTANISFASGLPGKQHYYIVYDFESNDLEIQSPTSNQVYIAGDSAYAYFKSPDGAATFSANISTDNGATYTLISSAIPAINRHVVFTLPAGTSSSACRIKISENGTIRTATSNTFLVSPRINVSLATLADQCPGSIKINWTATSSASAYVVYRNIFGEMKPVDTVSSSTFQYTFSGLNAGLEQWVSVAPIIGGKTAIRAVAVSRNPIDGGCESGPSGDLALVATLAPESGRMLTNTALGSAVSLQLQVRNQSNITQSSYKLSYSLNGGPLLSQTFSTAIPPGASANLTLSDHPVNFSAAGNYSVLAIVTNSAISDLISANDSLNFVIKQVANPPFNIVDGEEQNFESTSQSILTSKEIGLSGASSWDFLPSTSFGRAKNFVQTEITLRGSKSMSLDLRQNANFYPDSVSTNRMMATLNLAAADVSNKELRLEFDYRMHGLPKFFSENTVSIRGSDASPWIKVYTMDTTAIGSGKSTGSISINDYLLANSQIFSSSTQIMIQQKDTSLICGIDYGNGLTFDDVKVYPVSNDVALLSTNIPPQSCALAANTPIKIKVRNNVFYTVYNVLASYQIDGGVVVTESIDSISAKDTLEYTFATTADFTGKDTFSISSYIYLLDDSYTTNDSLLNIKVHNQVTKTTPRVELFTTVESDFYTNPHAAWRYGAQTFSPNPGTANSDFAWTTVTQGIDSLPSISYLYTPCYQLSIPRPTLSLSMLYNFENSDTLLSNNAGFVEYSTDGITWSILGDGTAGYEWYAPGKTTWADTAHNFWHVASIPLPSVPTISFRFGMKGGLTANQGMAIGGMFIHEGKPILDGNSEITASILPTLPYSSAVTERNDSITSEIYFGSQSQESATINTYIQDDSVSTNSFILPYSFKSKTKLYETNNYLYSKLYIPDAVFKRARLPLGCDNCTLPKSIYELSMYTYTSDIKEKVNGKLADNIDGKENYILAKDFTYLPYLNGYIALTSLHESSLQEYWFYDGGPDGKLLPNELAVELSVKQLSTERAQLFYTTKIDSFIQTYFIEQLTDSGWQERGNAASQNLQPAIYEAFDSIVTVNNIASWRIRYLLNDGRSRYSNTARLDFAPRPTLKIYPNPVNDGKFSIAYSFSNLAPLKISITDAKGQTILRRTEQGKFHGIVNIDMNQLSAAPGIYIVKIESGDVEATEKLVLIK